MSAGAPEDADFLEWNARSQVTSWFPVQGKTTAGCAGTATKLDGLWDCELLFLQCAVRSLISVPVLRGGCVSDGNKAWSGLVRGYYDRRYQLYADAKLQALTSRGSAQLTEDEEVRWPFGHTLSVV